MGAAFYRQGVGRWRPQSSECRLGTGQTAQGHVHGWWALGEDGAWEPLAPWSVWGQVSESPRVGLLCPEIEQVAHGGSGLCCMLGQWVSCGPAESAPPQPMAPTGPRAPLGCLLLLSGLRSAAARGGRGF